MYRIYATVPTRYYIGRQLVFIVSLNTLLPHLALTQWHPKRNLILFKNSAFFKLKFV